MVSVGVGVKVAVGVGLGVFVGVEDAVGVLVAVAVAVKVAVKVGVVLRVGVGVGVLVGRSSSPPDSGQGGSSGWPHCAAALLTSKTSTAGETSIRAMQSEAIRRNVLDKRPQLAN